ncbi:hypothetical protein RGUI_4263 (plasmid) [Rhodovulum sp. P5]|nr:hypothetical protein RGUI_4263 [Rhodovulum sp. P5]
MGAPDLRRGRLITPTDAPGRTAGDGEPTRLRPVGGLRQGRAGPENATSLIGRMGRGVLAPIF